MKSLIIEALDSAFAVVERQVPKEKKQKTTMSILDVSPVDLLAFMESNGIPKTARFWGTDNGYDAWDDVVLEWEESIPTTETDKSMFKRNRFEDVAFKSVYDQLTKSGYRRVGVNSKLLKPFNKINMYDMYVKKDLEVLVNYYSLFFYK